MRSTYGNITNIAEAERPKAYAVLVVTDDATDTVSVLMVGSSRYPDHGLPGGTVEIRSGVLHTHFNAWQRASIIADELIRECNEELGRTLMGSALQGQVTLVTAEDLLDKDKCYHHKGVHVYTDEQNRCRFTEMNYFIVNVTQQLKMITDEYTVTTAMDAAKLIVNDSHLSMSVVQRREVARVEFVTLESIASGATKVWSPHRDVLTDMNVAKIMRTAGVGSVTYEDEIDVVAAVSAIPRWVLCHMRPALREYCYYMDQNANALDAPPPPPTRGTWVTSRTAPPAPPPPRDLKNQLMVMFNVLTPPKYRDAMTLVDVANAVLPGPGPVESMSWTSAMSIAQVAAMAILFNVGPVVQALKENPGNDASMCDVADDDRLWITKFVMNTVAKMILTAHPEWRGRKFTDVVMMSC